MAMLGALAWLMVLVLVVAGAVVATLGWRGRRILTTPRCPTCDHDLRRSDDVWTNCPECGLDLEGGARVSFGRFERQPILIMIGLTLVFGVPMMTVFGVSVWTRPAPPAQTIITVQPAPAPPPVVVREVIPAPDEGDE